MADLDISLLAIHLQDQLAGSTAAVELSSRAARTHAGTDLGDALAALTLEAANDRQALVDLMALLDVGPDRVKTAAAWLGEKLGRLKLNGSLLRRSPLSDVVELDAMRMAVEWKGAGWRLLQALAASDSRLAQVDLDALVVGATDQAARIETLRIAVARDRLIR